MSFRIHCTPAPEPACMIRIKHHQLPKDRALAQLEAEVEYEDEYEDEIETKASPTPTPASSPIPHPHAVQPEAPLPAVVNAVAEPAQDETFKLRRKRRV